MTFSVLSRLVQLERIRDRRKDTLILQGESRKCPKVFEVSVQPTV